jgi:hypothetical protein
MVRILTFMGQLLHHIDNRPDHRACPTVPTIAGAWADASDRFRTRPAACALARPLRVPQRVSASVPAPGRRDSQPAGTSRAMSTAAGGRADRSAPSGRTVAACVFES